MEAKGDGAASGMGKMGRRMCNEAKERNAGREGTTRKRRSYKRRGWGLRARMGRTACHR